MIKANIIVRVEDGDNIYNVGDRVRVLMRPLTGHKFGYEYIGKIVDIQELFMMIDTYNENYQINSNDYVVIHYKGIDKMRFARDEENFNETWDFDD